MLVIWVGNFDGRGNPAFVGIDTAAPLFFRVADVIKPYPANRFEHLPGGVGVMADDGMAAVYANLALRTCIWSSGHLAISSFVLQLINSMTR